MAGRRFVDDRLLACVNILPGMVLVSPAVLQLSVSAIHPRHSAWIAAEMG